MTAGDLDEAEVHVMIAGDGLPPSHTVAALLNNIDYYQMRIQS